MKKQRIALPLIVALTAIAMTASLISADSPTNSSALRNAVTVKNIEQHMTDLAAFGPRPSGSAAHLAAAQYVRDQLVAVGYDVWYQDFTFDLWEELATPVMEKTLPLPVVSYPAYPTLPSDYGFATMEYSGRGNVTAPVAVATNLGCAATDFSGTSFTGKVALVLRGVCTFAEKATFAHNAGAVGVIIYNDQPRHEVFYGTLASQVVDIPVVGTSWAVGQELLASAVTVHLAVNAQIRAVATRNVIADSKVGRDDRVVVIGSHLDSVAEGPGVNDNGSGVATILEIAQQMSKLGIQPRNKVRFAFWTGEEQGLLGAQYYVDHLSARDIKNTALNLDFDMLASNNYVLFVYDGDGSATPDAGPNGSGNIEKIYLDYFASQNLRTYPTAFDGRSDYGPFIAVGIPAGGVFAGADERKTVEQAGIYGGTAGEFLDPYYHTPNDTLANINETALDRLSDAVADSILQFAMTGSAVNGTGKSSSNPKSSLQYWGNFLQK